MLKVRQIRFIPIGYLDPDVATQCDSTYDSDNEENVTQNTSSVATPSRSPYGSSRSVSASPACTPGSITKELTQVLDSETEEATTPTIAPVKKRKRLISDRGECELKFPICDYRTAHYNWSDCKFLNNRLRGVGLNNPSNYCFLNSVLQAVVHTAQLARYICEHHDLNTCFKQSPCITCGLKRHIHRVINSPKPVDAGWMRSFFSKIFPSHRRDHQEDAHEMLTMLLSALEPPVVPKKAAAETSTGGGDTKILKNGAQTTSSTAIEQIFGGNLRNNIICEVCKTPHVNYEKIREINVGLLPRYHGREVQLSMLLNDFFSEEVLQGFTCKTCNGKRSATRNTTILSSPSVLIIQLKRFNVFGGKNRLSVRPEPILHLDKFMYNREAQKYRFTGVIQHIGGGLNYGHYVSAFRGFDEKSWFHFDDADVSGISEQRALQMEPYILFYTKIRESSARPMERLLNGFKLSQAHVSPQVHASSSSTINGVASSNGFANNGVSNNDFAKKNDTSNVYFTSPNSFTGNGFANENRKFSPNGFANVNNKSSSNGVFNSPNGYTNHQKNNGLGTPKTHSNGFANGNNFKNGYATPNGKVNNGQGVNSCSNGNNTNGYFNGNCQKNGYRTPNAGNNSNKFNGNETSNSNSNGNNKNNYFSKNGNGKRNSSAVFSSPNGVSTKRRCFSVDASPSTSGIFKSVGSSSQQSNGSQTKTLSAAPNSNGTVSFKIMRKQPINSPLDLY